MKFSIRRIRWCAILLMEFPIPRNTTTFDIDNKNLAEKVGLFVFVCLALLGALLIMFSEGVTQFSHTYEIHLKTTDGGGIKPGATVHMVGYPVGNCAHLPLRTDG